VEGLGGDGGILVSYENGFDSGGDALGFTTFPVRCGHTTTVLAAMLAPNVETGITSDNAKT
jgi:hypothetical protein